MYRKKIHSVCNNWTVHPFPVARKYDGIQWRNGQRVHVLYCPVCGSERCYVYAHGNRIRRVA